MADDKEILIDQEILPGNSDLNNSPYCGTTISLHATNLSRNEIAVKNKFSIGKLFGRSSSSQRQIGSLAQIPVRKVHRKSQPNTFHDICRFHWKVLLSSCLTMISSGGCVIFFPIHLESVTSGLGSSSIPKSDSYSACFTISGITSLMILFCSLLVKSMVPNSSMRLGPISSWSNILKIGFSIGLSCLTIFYSWDQHKVVCNLQDPLLGLVFVFASLTHGISKWKELGYRRSFGLLAIGGGVFLSVDYQLVNHHRCRGHYVPIALENMWDWSWQVHLVWTIAFIVAVWLWTIAVFCMESSVSLKLIKKNKRLTTTNFTRNHHNSPNGYNAVKMKVLKISVSDLHGAGTETDTESPIPPEPQDIFQLPNYRSRIKNLATNNYTSISLAQVMNITLWFHLSSLFIIGCLFWTVFIPGFGMGIPIDQFPTVLENGFLLTISSTPSWLLIFSCFIFSLSFTYLLLLISSPILAIGIACLGFPIVGIWWSIVQIHHNSLIWMPVFSGELLCSILGFPIILGGVGYLFRLDVLKLDSRKNQRKDGTRISEIC